MRDFQRHPFPEAIGCGLRARATIVVPEPKASEPVDPGAIFSAFEVWAEDCGGFHYGRGVVTRKGHYWATPYCMTQQREQCVVEYMTELKHRLPCLHGPEGADPITVRGLLEG